MAAFSPTDVYLAGPGRHLSLRWHVDLARQRDVRRNRDVRSAIASSGTFQIRRGRHVGGQCVVRQYDDVRQSPVYGGGSHFDGVCVNGAKPKRLRANSSCGSTVPVSTARHGRLRLSTYSKRKPICSAPAPAALRLWRSDGHCIRMERERLDGDSARASHRPDRGCFADRDLRRRATAERPNRNFYRFDGVVDLIGDVALRAADAVPAVGRSARRRRVLRIVSARPRGCGDRHVRSHPVSYAPSMRDAIMTSATNAFTVGWNMFLARWNGTTWKVDKPPDGNRRRLAS